MPILEKIKISIITPVRNGEKFIESCIKNVIGQNCPGVEHIIVDADSGDSTPEIAQRFAGKYPHIVWISEKDRGQSDAMNKGIKMSRGEILGFLNVDDFYEPGVFSRVLEAFKTLPEPSLLAGNCNIWNDGGKLWRVNRPKKLHLVDFLSWRPYPVNPSAYFYHKSLHERIGYYNVEEHYALDLDFLLRAVQAAKTFYINVTLGNWRLIKGTKTYHDRDSKKRKINLFTRYQSPLPLTTKLKIRILRYIFTRPGYLKYGFKRLWQILKNDVNSQKT